VVENILKYYRKKYVINKVVQIHKTLYVNIPWRDIETYDIEVVEPRKIVYRVPGSRRIARTRFNRYLYIPREAGFQPGEYVVVVREDSKLIVQDKIPEDGEL